mmetsp:Transcript_31979/g.59099  ORF Transcript_31979/g.59099 Transcript_31979/m.59099 type:complete len:242 (-) Transcript_31979:665-1390(-)
MGQNTLVWVRFLSSCVFPCELVSLVVAQRTPFLVELLSLLFGSVPSSSSIFFSSAMLSSSLSFFFFNIPFTFMGFVSSSAASSLFSSPTLSSSSSFFSFTIPFTFPGSISDSSSSSLELSMPKAALCRFNLLFLRSSRLVLDLSASNRSSSIVFNGAKPLSFRMEFFMLIIVLRFNNDRFGVEVESTCSPFLILSRRLVDDGSIFSSFFPKRGFDDFFVALFLPIRCSPTISSSSPRTAFP